MQLHSGETIVSTYKGFGGVKKVIVAVRDTGYTWKYPNTDKEYQTDNSDDPFFDDCWKLK